MQTTNVIHETTTPTSVVYSTIYDAASEAANLVTGQRQKDYGDKLTNFTQIANAMSAIIGHKLTEPLSPEDVALLMIQVKVSRLAKSPNHRDSWIDIIGYALCAIGLQKERELDTFLPGSLVDMLAKTE